MSSKRNQNLNSRTLNQKLPNDQQYVTNEPLLRKRWLQRWSYDERRTRTYERRIPRRTCSTSTILWYYIRGSFKIS